MPSAIAASSSSKKNAIPSAEGGGKTAARVSVASVASSTTSSAPDKLATAASPSLAASLQRTSRWAAATAQALQAPQGGARGHAANTRSGSSTSSTSKRDDALLLAQAKRAQAQADAAAHIEASAQASIGRVKDVDARYRAARGGAGKTLGAGVGKLGALLTVLTTAAAATAAIGGWAAVGTLAAPYVAIPITVGLLVASLAFNLAARTISRLAANARPEIRAHLTDFKAERERLVALGDARTPTQQALLADLNRLLGQALGARGFGNDVRATLRHALAGLSVVGLLFGRRR